MKVLLAELGGSHIEVMYTLVHILYMKGHKVFLICNESLLEFIKEKEKISGIYFLPTDIKGPAMQLQVLKKINGVIRDNQIDTLIFGTTEIKPVRDLLPFLPCINITGIIHNSSKLNNSATFKYLYPLRIKKYIVLGDFIREHITSLPKEKVFAYYPVYFPKATDTKVIKPAHEKWIIVPGIVKAERKDYIPLLKKLSGQGLPENIKLIFLGKFYQDEKDIEALVNDINTTNEQIIIFDNYLDYDTFHTYLAKADFILPLLKITEDLFYDNKRISGAFNLAYGYRLPLLLPETYRKNTDMASFSIYYKTIEELYKIFLSVSKDNLYANSIFEAYIKTEKFNLNTMANQLISFVQKSSKPSLLESNE